MDEYIRPPDKPIRECLISPGFINNTDIYRNILQENEPDYELQFALAESKRMEEEREERKKHFADFLLKMKQFEKIDTANSTFYEEIVRHIETYERSGTFPVIVTEDFYNLFRNMVENIRLKPGDKERLLEFIKYKQDKRNRRNKHKNKKDETSSKTK